MRSRAFHGFILLLILIVAAGAYLLGIDWGLPSRATDEFLFAGGDVWPGSRIDELKPLAKWRDTSLGADVDRDPLSQATGWVDLTADDESRAEILIRYRLYSNQPDEQITLRSLAQMQPDKWDFDPRMYQYGGLFIYPIGALLKACDALEWITARSGLEYYYDHPEEFAKFYLVARGYVVFFALLGVIACYQLGRGLGGRVAGLIAAALYVCLPVIITMAHEAKPHLPAAVLMMFAVLAAFSYTKRPTNGRYFGVALLCGMSCAMVLGAWPVLALLVLALLLDRRALSDQWWRFVWGVLVAAVVYLVCNPYIVINLFRDTTVLASNFRNSTAMYEVGHFQAGAYNVVALMVAAMGPLAAVCGIFLAFTTPVPATWRRCTLLWVPAAIVVVMTVAIGAGKPGEFGRFLILPSIALMLPLAVFLRERFRGRRRGTGVGLVFAVAMTLLFGLSYEMGFYADTTDTNSRTAAASYLSEQLIANPNAVIGVRREPAPYAVPPLDFAYGRVVYLDRDVDLGGVEAVPDFVVTDFDVPPQVGEWEGQYKLVRVYPREDTPRAFQTVVSWANKPIGVYKKVPSD